MNIQDPSTDKKRLAELETPCLILDRGKMDSNIRRMARHLQQLGVPLRPHAKTPKNIDIVRRVIADQPGGITVSTLKEAEYFFEHGVRDILYAVGIAPVKLDHAGQLIQRGADLTIVLDSVEQADAAATTGRELGVVFPCLIEIDSDGHRSGIRKDDPRLLVIAGKLKDAQGAEFRGVMTHAGESYNCRSTEAIRAMAEQERDAVVQSAAILYKAGISCPVISAGSTPTATCADNLDGLTEMRAGVYIFHDLVMAGLGVCSLSDIAISVLTSVIGHQKEKGWLIIDAGWMALSRDRGTAAQAVDQGYGLVTDLRGQILGEIIVSTANQEHGIVAGRSDKIDVDHWPIGTMLRILPNHACATAGMHDRYYMVDGDDEVLHIWPRCNGWE